MVEDWSDGEHAQVSIVLGDQSAKVDEGIAPLILALWRHGIPTVASCESWGLLNERTGEETAYVAFNSEEGYTRFKRVVDDCSSVIVDARPDAHVAARIARDPAYAAECAEKGGPWAVGFPSADIERLTVRFGVAPT